MATKLLSDPSEKWLAITIVAGPLDVPDVTTFLHNFKHVFGRHDKLRYITITWDDQTSRISASLEALSVERNMLAHTELMMIEAVDELLDELPDQSYSYRVRASRSPQNW